MIESQGRSLWKDARRRFFSHKAAVVSLFILSIMVFFILIGPSFSPYSYDYLDWGHIDSPPGWEHKHYFGTDQLGRDLYVRILYGGRISFAVGLAGALVAVTIGTLYGAIAGFFGGRLDSVLMRIVDILNAFPFMFLVIVLVAFFGRSLILVFLAIGAVSWLDTARMVRGQALSLKEKEFIEAAHVIGTPRFLIILRHIVPNVLGVVVVYASLLIPSMIIFEAFLSFLGLGVQEPMTSWGALVNEGAQTMELSPWQLWFPAGFLVITLLCFNFLGDGLRDALDPKHS